MVLDKLILSPQEKSNLSTINNLEISWIGHNAVLMKYLKKQLVLRKNFGPEYFM